MGGINCDTAWSNKSVFDNLKIPLYVIVVAPCLIVLTSSCNSIIFPVELTASATFASVDVNIKLVIVFSDQLN